MIDAVIKASLMLLATACCSRVFRLQSAAVRHMIWTVGLIFALVIPLCTRLLPSWDVELTPPSLDLFEPVQTATQIPTPSTVVTVVGDRVFPARSVIPIEIVFYIWLTGVGIGVLWLLAGSLRLAWIAFRAKPMTSERWSAILSDVSRTLRLKRPVRLLQNDHVTMMGTWGIFRGHVLLPRDAETWADERVRVVLAHELAHIKRNDWLIQVAAESARVLYWFNPLFWFACARLRCESEHACDDAVLRLGVDGQAYAVHLLDLARALKSNDAAWSAVLTMARPPHLERRFFAMLNSSLNHRPASAAAMIVIAVVALCFSLPLAAMRLSGPALQSVAPNPPARPAPPPPPARSAQAAFGSLSGTAYDPSGAVIPGVTVAATNLQTKATETVTSGPVGDFVFRRLQAGDYSLQADVPGFATTRIGRLAIPPNQDVKQNVSLIVGNVTETVVVRAAGPPKPPTLIPAETPRRIRVGGNVGATRLISSVKPIYPPAAQNAGVEGTVRLQGIIGTDGSMQAVRVLSSIDPDLTTAALEAVRQWRYTPTLLNGVPVETLTNIVIEFKQPQ